MSDTPFNNLFDQARRIAAERDTFAADNERLTRELAEARAKLAVAITALDAFANEDAGCLKGLYAARYQIRMATPAAADQPGAVLGFKVVEDRTMPPGCFELRAADQPEAATRNLMLKSSHPKMDCPWHFAIATGAPCFPEDCICAADNSAVRPCGCVAPCFCRLCHPTLPKTPDNSAAANP